MAMYAPITGAPTRAPIILTREQRATIARQIETLIDLLDHADGDTDLEPEEDRCLAGDDGCAPVHDILGKLAWGSPDEDRGRLIPRYAVDQTTGPINYRLASRDYRAAEMGLVRTAKGGWRMPS